MTRKGLWLAKQADCPLKPLHARKPEGRGGRRNAAKLSGQRRNRLAVTVRLARGSGFRNSFTTQRKRHAERGGWGATDDVGAYPQPVRAQVRITDPRLKIADEWVSRRHNRSGRRQVEEVATSQQNLGAEEIMSRRQNDRTRECDRDLDLVAGHRALAHGLTFLGRLVMPFTTGLAPNRPPFRTQTE